MVGVGVIDSRGGLVSVMGRVSIIWRVSVGRAVRLTECSGIARTQPLPNQLQTQAPVLGYTAHLVKL